MKAFVWKYLDNLTSNYHSGGGLLLIAEDLESAIGFFKLDGGTIELPPPDFVFEAPGHTNRTEVVFPDAGCC